MSSRVSKSKWTAVNANGVAKIECSRGKGAFFPSEQAIVGTQKRGEGGNWKRLHGAAARKLKRGSWARGLSGRGLPYAEDGLGRNRTDDVRISKGTLPSTFFFCMGNRQKSRGSGVVMRKTLVVCFGQDVCGEV